MISSKMNVVNIVIIIIIINIIQMGQQMKAREEEQVMEGSQRRIIYKGDESQRRKRSRSKYGKIYDFISHPNNVLV